MTVPAEAGGTPAIPAAPISTTTARPAVHPGHVRPSSIAHPPSDPKINGMLDEVMAAARDPTIRASPTVCWSSRPATETRTAPFAHARSAAARSSKRAVSRGFLWVAGSRDPWRTPHVRTGPLRRQEIPTGRGSGERGAPTRSAASARRPAPNHRVALGAGPRRRDAAVYTGWMAREIGDDHAAPRTPRSTNTPSYQGWQAIMPTETRSLHQLWASRRPLAPSITTRTSADTYRADTNELGHETLEQIAYLAGLPPIRLHDLRHGAAILAQIRQNCIRCIIRQFA